MIDARAWTPPDRDEVRALLPQTQAERDALAPVIGVSKRTVRYWWAGKYAPSYAQWRLLVEMQRVAAARAMEQDDERRVPRR